MNKLVRLESVRCRCTDHLIGSAAAGPLAVPPRRSGKGRASSWSPQLCPGGEKKKLYPGLCFCKNLPFKSLYHVIYLNASDMECLSNECHPSRYGRHSLNHERPTVPRNACANTSNSPVVLTCSAPPLSSSLSYSDDNSVFMFRRLQCSFGNAFWMPLRNLTYLFSKIAIGFVKWPSLDYHLCSFSCFMCKTIVITANILHVYQHATQIIILNHTYFNGSLIFMKWVYTNLIWIFG